MAELATFKSPSKIEFVIKAPLKYVGPRLSETKRGDTFLWQAEHGRHGPAICMRTSVSGYQGMIGWTQQARTGPESLARDWMWITNLQSGRTFIALDCAIEYVKLTLTVEGK